MVPRFYCPGLPEAPTEFVLPKDVAHHAVRVLRLCDGAPVAVFDGAGREFAGVLCEHGNTVCVQQMHSVDAQRESPLDITLVQALAVADKMDWIVQKAVELGVRHVQPIEAERCVLRLAGDRASKRIAHWQQVAVAASEQCGRNHVCRVAGLLRLAQWLQTPPEGERWILAPEGGVRLASLPRPTGRVALLVGPEGGWSEAELELARAAGCRAVSLGPRVLRTETAGMAAMAAMSALWGDF